MEDLFFNLYKGERQMEIKNLLDKFSKKAFDFLNESIDSNSLLPKAEELFTIIKEIYQPPPSLERYNQIKKRMDISEDYIIPPNFSYTFRAS